MHGKTSLNILTSNLKHFNFDLNYLDFNLIMSSCLYKHWWFSGRMLACHAGGPGSIPGQCIYFFKYFKASHILLHTEKKNILAFKNIQSNLVNPDKSGVSGVLSGLSVPINR